MSMGGAVLDDGFIVVFDDGPTDGLSISNIISLATSLVILMVHVVCFYVVFITVFAICRRIL